MIAFITVYNRFRSKSSIKLSNLKERKNGSKFEHIGLNCSQLILKATISNDKLFNLYMKSIQKWQYVPDWSIVRIEETNIY